jgi:LacI family transcriptional regulator
MRRRYVSIKEVAAKAGVSFQTASKVLNGGNVRVSEETAARIMAVAERLGYRPNTVARSLVQRSTATIGLIAGDITDAALSQFALAAERTARRNARAVLVGNLAEGGEDGAAVARMLIERRVDGIIAAAPQLEEDPEVADLLRRYVPAVSLHHVPGGGVPLVGSNHRAGGRLATEHLIRLGHSSIGTVTGPFRRHVVRSRLHGYEDALRAAGIEPGEDLTVESDWTPGGAAAATRLLLQRDPAMTAIFVHSDTMAIGVLSALAGERRRVPGDVAVVSCDDMPFAAYLIPPLTSLRVPFAETGEQAVALLLRSIAGEPLPDEPVRLPVELIVRASCGGQGRGSAPPPRSETEVS